MFKYVNFRVNDIPSRSTELYTLSIQVFDIQYSEVYNSHNDKRGKIFEYFIK